MPGQQRRIGLREFRLPDLAQAIGGVIIVRLLRNSGLEKLPCAGAILTIEMACLERLLRAAQRVVEISAWHHAAQGALVDPQRRGNCDHQQQKQRYQPATPAATRPVARGLRRSAGARLPRFDRDLRETVSGRRMR